MNPGGSVKDRVAVKVIEEVIMFFFSFYDNVLLNIGDNVFTCI